MKIRNAWLRWFLRHGLPRAAIGYGVRRGHPVAALMGDPDVQDDPFYVQGVLREQAAVVPGMVAAATCRFATVDQLVRSADMEAGSRSSGSTHAILSATHDDRTAGPLDPPSLLVIDPPEHPRYRRLVNGIFSPRAVMDMRPRIEEITDRLLDEMERQPQVDLIDSFAKRLPVAVIADLLGTPESMLDQFLQWSERGSPILDIGLDKPGFEDAEQALREVNDWLDEYLEKLRDHPGDDFISSLLRAHPDQPLDDVELRATVQLMLAAGFVTIVDMIGNGVVTLLQNPRQLALLREDASLWPNAVEEILRLESPVQITARFAKCPVEFGDTKLSKGKLVLGFLGAANRDPRKFENPDTFDVRRKNAREHLAFSRGLHHCAGAGLARLEGAVAFPRLFARFPDLALAGEPTRRYSGVLRGYTAVPLSLGTPDHRPYALAAPAAGAKP